MCTDMWTKLIYIYQLIIITFECDYYELLTMIVLLFFSHSISGHNKHNIPLPPGGGVGAGVSLQLPNRPVHVRRCVLRGDAPRSVPAARQSQGVPLAQAACVRGAYVYLSKDCGRGGG